MKLGRLGGGGRRPWTPPAQGDCRGEGRVCVCVCEHIQIHYTSLSLYIYSFFLSLTLPFHFTLALPVEKQRKSRSERKEDGPGRQEQERLSRASESEPDAGQGRASLIIYANNRICFLCHVLPADGLFPFHLFVLAFPSLCNRFSRLLVSKASRLRPDGDFPRFVCSVTF